MTGFPPDQQQRLLDLQALDSRADVLDQQRRTHPAIAAVAELDAQAEGLRVEITVAESAVEESRGRLKAAEREAEDITRRQDRDRARLDAGNVSSPRELESLQHEVATLQAKLDDVETVELEAMEELDGAEAMLAERRGRLADVEAARQQRQDELSTALQGLDAEREAVSADRAEVTGNLPDDLVARYERSRGKHGGVGVGALRHGRCEGCRLGLTPADLARINEAPPDQLVTCEECGRLLVRVED